MSSIFELDLVYLPAFGQIFFTINLYSYICVSIFTFQMKKSPFGSIQRKGYIKIHFNSRTLGTETEVGYN